MDKIKYITTNLDNKIDFYIDNIIDDNIIIKNRKKIRKELDIDLKNFKLTKDIIKKLFTIFDKIYFTNFIQEKLDMSNIKIYFDISNKCKNIAGYCKYYDNKKIGIVFSNKIIEKIHNDEFKNIKISDILCNDIIDVLIVLMEHEITHFILFIYDKYKNDIKSGHNRQFKNIVYNMYRHTKITHELLFGDLDKYEEHKKTASDNIKIGMKIKCNKKAGTVIKLHPKYIIFINDNNKIGSCRYNEYEITDTNYDEYKKYISNLKKKITVGVNVKDGKYYGPVTKIVDDRVYFTDINTKITRWCIINFITIV
jgi:hypothetical protein